MDSKIRPQGWHHEACRVMLDCDPEGRIDSFSCIPFISESAVFDNAVTLIADVRQIVNKIP